MMLGMGSVEIALAFWLCIAATALCVGYGLYNWNKGGVEKSPKKEGDA